MALGMVFAACNDDYKKDYDPKPDPADKIGAPVASIAEGATVDAEATKVITLTYEKPVALNPDVPILLNDADAKAVVNEENRCEVRIDVTLAAGTDYKLFVAERAVAVIDAAWFAPEFTLNFSTEAKEIVSDFEALVNPNATAAAKAVHDFLVAEHGKHILSGAMANVNNNNDFADWIYSFTNKYPAIVGYDFIHLPESLKGENWIDYNDISAAKAQWAANGLVSYMWHWRVPTDEQAWKDKDYSKYGCRAPGDNVEDPTDFNIENALKEGTWEHECILADIDEVAKIFKLLEAEGIPVLWRPLHEAAGSYKYNGAWFWWGAKGGEATKELWKLMYDRLVNHNGVNNLIWVWTAQYEEGYESQMIADYPGNEYVDVIGVDVYADDDNSQKAAYDALLSLGAGKKLVALSETGMLQNPDKCEADGADWSWFNLWYTYDAHKNDPSTDGFGNTKESIKAVFDSPFTLNREDMPTLK